MKTHALSLSLGEWRDAGRYTEYRGHRIFLRTQGGNPAAPVLLLIHGFPTASADWRPVWDALAARYCLIAPDLIGFGFSDKPRDYDYSLHDQADLVEALLTEAGIGEYHVLAHDYGVSVAQELLARHEQRHGIAGDEPRLRSVCFTNGGLFPETHRARVVQKILNSPLGFVISHLMSRRAFDRTMGAIFGPHTQPSAAELDDFWALLSQQSGQRIGHKLIRYITERKQSRDRWVDAMQRTRVPLKLIDGVVDPISGGHMVQRYRELVPDADITELPQIGHYPQCEAPDEVVAAYLQWQGTLAVR